MTDEIGVMFENTLSRLQALESAIMIRMRQIAETKLATAIKGRQESKERINNVRKQIESKSVSKPRPKPRAAKSKPATKAVASKPKPKPTATKPSPRLQKDRARGTCAAKAKR
jgi:cell division protein FtsN